MMNGSVSRFSQVRHSAMLLGAKAQSPSAVNVAAQDLAAKHADGLDSSLESV